MNLRIWVGLIISAGLLWLSARNVDFGSAWDHMRAINGWYLVPYMILALGEVLIRALKWQVLLLPLKRCSFWKLSSATLIGLMANNILPARAGEFVRAYAGSRLQGIPYSTSFATVVIDRVTDGLTVSAIFVFALLFQPLPDELKAGGYLAAGIYLVALCVLIGLIVRESATTHLLEAVLRPFPPRISQLGLRALRSFVSGLGVFHRRGLLLATTAISFAIWVGYAVTVYLMALAFSIELSLLQAFIVLLILTIVLTLPSSPGFVGAMEWAITTGLVLFRVEPSQAFAFAVVYHVTQYVPITLGGLMALWLEPLTMGEIAHAQAPAPQD